MCLFTGSVAANCLPVLAYDSLMETSKARILAHTVPPNGIWTLGSPLPLKEIQQEKVFECD